MALTKIKLHMSQYPMLNFTLISDTEFIVNVPLKCKAGDRIPVIICDNIVSISCPQLKQKERRFVIYFVDKRVTWARGVWIPYFETSAHIS